MNLKDMLIELGDLCNKSPEVPADKAILTRQLNRAARILWQNDDMPMSLRSVYIEAPTTNNICFPEFVGQVRGVRRCRVPIALINESVRYVNKIPEGCWTPTVLHRSPISDNSVDFADMRIEFASAVDCAAVVTVTGPTASSNYVKKILTFGKGEKVKLLNTGYIGITAIYKDIVSGSDMRLMAGVDDELAVIPANQNTSQYIIYQIADVCPCECINDGCRPCFELFYKPTLVSFSDDYNLFQADGVDMALVYYAAGLYKLDTAGDESRQQSKDYIAQALAVLGAANRDDAIGKKAPIGIMRRGFFRPVFCGLPYEGLG